jgi:hypothetical protein
MTSIVVWFQSVTTSAFAVRVDRTMNTAIATTLRRFMMPSVRLPGSTNDQGRVEQ